MGFVLTLQVIYLTSSAAPNTPALSPSFGFRNRVSTLRLLKMLFSISLTPSV